MNTTTMAESSDLPYIPNVIILEHILPQLPIKSLCRFKCLNKQFYSTISDPNFKLSSRNRDRILLLSLGFGESKGKLEYYLMNNKGLIEKHTTPPIKRPVYYNEFNVLGSCNGLILFSVKDEIFLWNPSIFGSCKKVLELDRLRDDDYYAVSGFCYDDSKNDYVVVVKLTHSTPSYGGRFVISASLKSKIWSNVSFPYAMDSARDGPVVNNRFHWVVSRDNPFDDDDLDFDDVLSFWDTPHDTIIYFDCSSNQFEMLPLPDPIINGVRDEIVGLVVMDECLCMMRQITFGGSKCDVEILVMKEYGVRESWTSTFIISNYNYDHSSTVALRREKVIDSKHYDELCFMIGSKLHVYNPATKKLRLKSYFGKKDMILYALPYVEAALPKGYYWRPKRHKKRARTTRIHPYET